MNLKLKQLQAASLLAQGWLCKDVAEAVRVTPQTISEWRKLPAFEAHVNSLKMEMLNSAVTHIQSLAEKAVATLADLMESGGSDSIRLKSAEAVLACTGISDPQSGAFAWRIGGTTVEDIERKRSHEKQMKDFGAVMFR